MARDGAHLARLQVNDVRLRRQLDEYYRALGRAVYHAHKHARGDGPFDSLEEVKTELAALEAALGDYRSNREARARTREHLRRSGH